MVSDNGSGNAVIIVKYKMTFHTYVVFILPFVPLISNTIQLCNSHLIMDDIATLPPECETILEQFAISSSNFTFCTIKYSHPIHACQNCVEYYMSVVNNHKKILDTKDNQTKCKDKLVNLDRLEIIESTFGYIQDIWTRGFCNKCFDWNNDTASLSDKTKTFVKYHNTTIDCINEHKEISNDTDIICKNCMTEYIALNSFYESLKDKSETVGICMDIVDLMNATRSIWSDQLNCCKLRRTPEFIFLCCTAIITALPAMFYLFARYYCDSAITMRPVSFVN